MAELPLALGIERFKDNEDRFDRFTNGTDSQTFTHSDSGVSPTIRKFLKDKDDEINVAAGGILAQSQTAANTSTSKAAEAAASAAAASASAGNALTSQIAAAASAANAETLAETFETVRTLPYAGAVSRTLASISQDWINFRDFKTPGAVDDTADLQRMLNAGSDHGGGIVVIDDPLSVSANITNYDGVHIMGTSKRRVGITQTTNNVPIVTMSGTKGRISGLHLTYSGSPATGATALKFTGPVNSFDDILITNARRGVEQLANDISGKNFRIENCTQLAILCQGVVQGRYSDFVLYGDIASGKSSLGNIRLQDQCEAIVFSDGKVLAGQYSITTDATTFQNTLCPAYCEFNNVHFDGAKNGSELNKIMLSAFNCCWISGGREGSTNGMTLLNTLALTFTNTRIANCGTNGLRVLPQSLSLVIMGGQGFDNGAIAAAAGTVIGAIKFEDGCTGFIVRDFQGGNDAIGDYSGFSGKQTHTAVIGSGCTSFEVSVKNRSNLTGAVYQGTAAGATEVYSNCF